MRVGGSDGDCGREQLVQGPAGVFHRFSAGAPSVRAGEERVLRDIGGLFRLAAVLPAGGSLEEGAVSVAIRFCRCWS